MTTELFEKIDNFSLIENSLAHLQFELTRETASYFRVAREAHHVLYRSMIEALKGSNNFAVTGRRDKNRCHIYRIADKNWLEIHKVPVSNGTKAWRFSDPHACAAPNVRKHSAKVNENYLIGFYDALAMIQAECFMSRFIHSKPVAVSDLEMNMLEWLHEKIRNEYEHFIPKLYLAPTKDLFAASELCLKLSQVVLFQSGTLLFHRPQHKAMEQSLDKTIFQIQHITNAIS